MSHYYYHEGKGQQTWNLALPASPAVLAVCQQKITPVSFTLQQQSQKKKKIRDVAYISEDPISNLAHPRHAPYCIQSFFPVSLNPIMNRNLGSYIIAGGLTDRTVLGNVTASQLYHLHERFFFYACIILMSISQQYIAE